MTALQPASHGAGADEQAEGAEVLVAHPGGVEARHFRGQ